MSEWKLVPVEPTQEMIDAGCDEEMRHANSSKYKCVAINQNDRIYRAMLAASPSPSPLMGVEEAEIAKVIHQAFVEDMEDEQSSFWPSKCARAVLSLISSRGIEGAVPTSAPPCAASGNATSEAEITGIVDYPHGVVCQRCANRYMPPGPCRGSRLCAAIAAERVATTIAT